MSSASSRRSIAFNENLPPLKDFILPGGGPRRPPVTCARCDLPACGTDACGRSPQRRRFRPRRLAISIAFRSAVRHRARPARHERGTDAVEARSRPVERVQAHPLAPCVCRRGVDTLLDAPRRAPRLRRHAACSTARGCPCVAGERIGLIGRNGTGQVDAAAGRSRQPCAPRRRRAATARRPARRDRRAGAAAAALRRRCVESLLLRQIARCAPAERTNRRHEGWESSCGSRNSSRASDSIPQRAPTRAPAVSASAAALAFAPRARAGPAAPRRADQPSRHPGHRAARAAPA